jgi:hypothetical protein
MPVPGWDVIQWEGEPPVQVVPSVEWPTGVQHILDDDCWCRPYRDGKDGLILVHRETAHD